MPCSAIISIISLKEVNLCWNEKLGSFFEPKVAQPERKAFTDIKSFLLDSAALKTSARKKEKHLHWFSLFNTQEWKSVKSQSLYHHKKRSFIANDQNTSCLQSFTQLTSTNPGSTFWPSFETPAVHKHQQHRALAISHILLDLLCSICFLDQWFAHLKKQCPTSDLYQHRNTEFFPSPNH